MRQPIEDGVVTIARARETLSFPAKFMLLERNRRGVRLTPEGTAFLAEATAVVQQADRAVEVARAWRKVPPASCE